MATFAPRTQVSVEHILFPTDFSPTASAALPFAAAFARLYDATIYMAHVLAPEPRLHTVPDRVPAQDNLPWEQARQRLLDSALDPSLWDTHCRTLTGQGDLIDVIPNFIRDHHIDLVIVGTHGRRGVSKLVMGSAAEKIFRVATCPVMTVGPSVNPRFAHEWRIERILFPVDLTDVSESALHYAISLAEERQADLLLLHTDPMVPWQHRDSVEVGVRGKLASLIPEEVRDGRRPECLVRWEHPAEAIVSSAQERMPDLIVMGVRGSHAAAWSSHLPWPTASEVISRAPCPVLTVRV